MPSHTLQGPQGPVDTTLLSWGGSRRCLPPCGQPLVIPATTHVCFSWWRPLGPQGPVFKPGYPEEAPAGVPHLAASPWLSLGQGAVRNNQGLSHSNPAAGVRHRARRPCAISVAQSGGCTEGPVCNTSTAAFSIPHPLSFFVCFSYFSVWLSLHNWPTMGPRRRISRSRSRTRSRP